MIRLARPDDVADIKRIAVDTKMFAADEVDTFDEMLEGFFDGSLDGHQWLVPVSDVAVCGAAYLAPEPFSDRVWNLYFLAVDPLAHGTGVGTELIDHVVASLSERGGDVARVLIVETSSTDQYRDTRAFYVRRGFVEESTIREFYGPGDHKVTFWQSLVDGER